MPADIYVRYLRRKKQDVAFIGGSDEHGVLNNAPSLGELEAKAKAGEQISLTDLAAAVKAEEKAPKAKKSRAAKPKKPSIRAQLDAAKKEQRKQTQPREKSKELEV